VRREADRAAGPKLTCPVPVIRAARDDMKRLHGDPAAVWHGWASNVTGLPASTRSASARILGGESTACERDECHRHEEDQRVGPAMSWANGVASASSPDKV